MAGAVEGNRCPMTNISWVIDGAELELRFGFKCATDRSRVSGTGGGPPSTGAAAPVLHPSPFRVAAPCAGPTAL